MNRGISIFALQDYKAYIQRVHKLLKRDLQELYPQLNLDFEDATKDLLRKIHERTGDEIFSAMVVYGFLTYKDGKVSIPNRI